MSNYYEMRDAKVRIAHELMNRGWTVHNYKPNESDSMTDYYSPANWGGIATKNGFILVVDNYYAAESTPIYKYNYGSCLSHADKLKIEKLEAMTQERGATAGEEANAKAMIEKIKANTSDKPEKEITGYTIAHMANPGKCKWHIQKDNSIFDKGTGITKYSDVPEEYRFDINTMEYKDSYKYHSAWENGEYVRKENTITDEERKLINDFKALILRWERIVNNMNSMYDGSAENKKAADEQSQNEKMEKVIEKVTKKVLRMVEVTDRKEIQKNDVLTFSYHGHYWLVTDVWTNSKGKTCIDYECLGSEKRGYQRVKNTKSYYQLEERLIKEMEAGKVKLFTLQEVEEVIEVEKWVRVKAETKKTNKTNLHTEEVKETPETENTNNSQPITDQNDYTITEDIDTRDNSAIWVLKLNNKVSKEEFNTIREYIKSLGGYYSRFKGGFIFKSAPYNVLGIETKQAETMQEVATEQQQENQVQENPYNPEFKEGFIYNVHFKEWNLSITELKESLKVLGLEYKIIDLMGDKIGLQDLNYSEVLQVKELSNRNGSILFKDAEVTESEYSITQTVIDISTTVICELGINKEEWQENEEFKNRFAMMLKACNITSLTESIFNYLESISYNKLVKVLKSLCQFQENNVEEVLNSENEYNSNPKIDHTKLLDKLEKQLESNNKRIDHLSGNYLTNTWKRMKEQENRDKEKSALQKDNSILEYIKTKIAENTITELEKALIVKAFRSDIHNYYLRHNADKKYTSYAPIEFPHTSPNYGQWHNEEVPKKQKRLINGGIHNTSQLIKAVEEYKDIMDIIEDSSKINKTQEKIKKLEREYKMTQKGDVHFTNNSDLLEKLMELADIEEGEKVLEPSAGIGSIADTIKQYTNNIDVCEYMHSYAELLKLKGYTVKTNDFLQYAAYNTYDKIVANVPFSDEINHIKHIYKMLKVGGKAVIITSNSWTFRSDKATQNFREWLNNLTYEVYDVPEKSFEFTNVICKILVIDKNEETKEEAM